MFARVAVLFALTSAPVVAQVPFGWFTPSRASKDCAVTLDQEVHRTGSASARLICSVYPGRFFENIIQAVNSAEYRGKRLRLSAWLKPNLTKGKAQLWMRTDGPGAAVLTFDNMERHPLTGQFDWQYRKLVLDVPARSLGFMFGAFLQGVGDVWLDDVKLEVVGPEVPSTNKLPVPMPFDDLESRRARAEPADQFIRTYTEARREPVNLDFEQPNEPLASTAP